jgi:branched-chain amino acid aminotransferase
MTQAVTQSTGTATGQTTEMAYHEGRFCPFSDANISIKTHAFLYGTAIFEGIRGYWLPATEEVCLFRLREHYQRLLDNTKLYYLKPTRPTEQTVEGLIDLTTQLVTLNQHQQDIYVRPSIYKTGLNITPSLENTQTEMCIWTHPLGQYLDLTKGLKVCVSNWRRIDDNALPPRAKASANYLNTALMVTDSKAAGFDDAIALNPDGTVSEGSAMNLFLVRHGKLITPAKTDNILEGITRDTIVTIAKNELGIDTEQRSVDRTELYMCDEAFFCGTGAQVAPIASIDNRAIGDGTMGPITKQIQELYFKVVRNELPQYSHWCTRVHVPSPASSPVGV